ncbi:hypothetical protein N7453_008607 [Penicillium expansum]|nr:hypothetical protein N7453_008607 [Penicillium expansum]
MLYELIAIVRPGSLNEVREIARNAGTQVIRSGGVVRGYTNWGAFRLPGSPRNIRPDTPKVTTSSCALTPPALFSHLSAVLSVSTRLGDKLEEIKDIEGKVEWNNVSTITEQI